GDGEAEGLAYIGLAVLAMHDPNGSKQTEELARRASAAFVRAGHELGRLRAEGMIGHALWTQQRHAEARRVCEAALEQARRAHLGLAIHELSKALGLILLEQGQWLEAVRIEEEALRLAIEEGWPGAVGEGLSALMIIDALTGNAARALRRARPAVRLAR